MPRRVHHEPAPPACCCYGCDGGGCAPTPCCCPAPVSAPCSYPAPAPVPTPCYYPAPVPTPCYYPAPAPVPAPPSSSTTDHLLQAIAAHLLLGSSAPAPAPAPAPPPQSQPPPPQAPTANHATNPYPYPHRYQYQYQQQEAKTHAYAHPPPAQQHPHHPQPDASDHGHLVLHSLLRRVAALESALPRRSPHPAPVRRAPHPIPRPRRVPRQQLVEDNDDDNNGDVDSDSNSSPPSSPPRLHRRPQQRASPRELAAWTIQAHFRRFLARRSRTLRQLKELAVLRSKAAALRGALSGRRGGADPAVVSEAAMGLLLQLDAIQGSDPMIREGRRAVSRELTRILEFVDKVLVKEHEQLSMGNALDNGDYHEDCSAEFGPNRPAVNKKKVSFSSNGQTHQLKEDSGNVKEVDEGYESSGSSESEEVKGMPAKRSANGKPGLAAPTPAHMESRRVAGENR